MGIRRCRCHEKNFSAGEGAAYVVWKGDPDPRFYLNAYEKIRRVQAVEEQRIVDFFTKMRETSRPNYETACGIVAELKEGWTEVARLFRRTVWKDACMSVLLDLCNANVSACDCDLAAAESEKKLSAAHLERRIDNRVSLNTLLKSLIYFTCTTFRLLEEHWKRREQETGESLALANDVNFIKWQGFRGEMVVLIAQCNRMLKAYCHHQCEGVFPPQ